MSNTETPILIPADITDALKAIRKSGYRAEGKEGSLWYILGFDEHDEEYKKALLIKFIDHFFSCSDDGDILLMAFGLLKGYGRIKSISDRRKLYLDKSDYLKPNEANGTRAHDRLRKNEESLIWELSGRMTAMGKIANFIKDVDEYLEVYKVPGGTKTDYRAILPDPYYLGRLSQGPQPVHEPIHYNVEAGSTFGIIRDNHRKYFNEYKENNLIKFDPAILPQVEPQTGSGTKLADILKGQANESLILLCGGGGVGKSYILLDCCETLMTTDEYLPLYIPMRLVQGDSPVLQYTFDHFFLHIDGERNPDALKKSIRDITSHGNTKIVFFLDGFNEYAFAAADSGSAVLREIEWLQSMRNVQVVVASRSDKGFDSPFIVRVKELDIDRVKQYLKEHENTSTLDIAALNNERILVLLQTPLMLALFTKTYSPKYTGLSSIDINSVKTHSDVLKLCVEYQKNRLRKTSKANYVLDILLPLVTLDSDMKLNFAKPELAEEVKRELSVTLSDEYRKLWFKDEYNRSDFLRDDSLEPILKYRDEYALYKDFFAPTILENAVFLAEHNDIVSWQHELLMDWFAARGIVLMLEYQHDDAVSKLKHISENIIDLNIKADGLLPVALFLVEMLENGPFANSVEFILLLSSLARAYHSMKDSKNIDKFAKVALEKMDTGYMSGYPQWQYADQMNHVAYTLLSVHKEDMGDDFDLNSCIDYALAHLNHALEILQNEISDDNARNTKLAEAQVYGNLGAYYQRKFDATKNLDFIYKAIDYHQQGLDARQSVLGNDPKDGNDRGFIGTSYHCFAIDYFKLSDNRRSLENHRLAIQFRENDSVPDIKKMESYTRCLGTLIDLLSADDGKQKEYLDEIFGIFKKALMLESGDEKHVLSSLNCLLKNHRELKSLQKSCGRIFKFMHGNPQRIDYDARTVIQSAAAGIDKLCDRVSIPSDLNNQIKIHTV